MDKKNLLFVLSSRENSKFGRQVKVYIHVRIIFLTYYYYYIRNITFINFNFLDKLPYK